MSVHESTHPPAAGASESLRSTTLAKGFFFLAAGLSFLMSVYLFFNGDQERGIFVGLWVPSILSGGSLLLGGGHRDH